MKITYTIKIDDEGNKRWYHNDKLHRTDGPAIEWADGTKYWYVDGKRHRTDGPAVEWSYGTKFWYHNDKLHRTDGPAVECADGTKYWYVDGKRHRTDGPAIEYANGTKYWYLDDVQLTEAQWRKRVAKPNCEGKVVEVDGVQYKLGLFEWLGKHIMKNKNLIDWFIGIGIVLVVVLMIGGCTSYKINLYKRKYPGTTTFDYFMDDKK